MIKAIIKGVYSGRIIEEKQFETYAMAEDYAFTKYNAVYDIDSNEEEVAFYVYQD